MVRQDADGNYVPISPINLPDNAYMYRSMISEAHFPYTETIGVDCLDMLG